MVVRAHGQCWASFLDVLVFPACDHVSCSWGSTVFFV